HAHASDEGGAIAVLAGEPHHHPDGREGGGRERDLRHVHEPDDGGLEPHSDGQQRDDDVLRPTGLDPLRRRNRRTRRGQYGLDQQRAFDELVATDLTTGDPAGRDRTDDEPGDGDESGPG